MQEAPEVPSHCHASKSLLSAPDVSSPSSLNRSSILPAAHCAHTILSHEYRVPSSADFHPLHASRSILNPTPYQGLSQRPQPADDNATKVGGPHCLVLVHSPGTSHPCVGPRGQGAMASSDGILSPGSVTADTGDADSQAKGPVQVTPT